jgi:hypothetical protein
MLAHQFHTPIDTFTEMAMWELEELVGLANEMNRER